MGTLPFSTDALISGQDRTCVPLVTVDAVRGFWITVVERARMCIWILRQRGNTTLRTHRCPKCRAGLK